MGFFSAGASLPRWQENQYAKSYTSFSSRFRFNGKEWDEETGNYYYGARYYDPKVSVWLSVDPLAHKYPAWSSYNFVMNNPLLFIDPDGREVEYNKFRDRIKVAWNRLTNSSFRSNFNTLKKSSELYVFNGSVSGEEGSFTTDGSKLYLNYSFSGGNKSSGTGRSTSLLHETEHGVQFEHGELGFQNFGSVVKPKWEPIAYDLTDELKALQAGSLSNGSTDYNQYGKMTFQGKMSTIAVGISNKSQRDQNISIVLSYYPKKTSNYQKLFRKNNVQEQNSISPKRIQNGKYFIRPHKKR